MEGKRKGGGGGETGWVEREIDRYMNFHTHIRT